MRFGRVGGLHSRNSAAQMVDNDKKRLLNLTDGNTKQASNGLNSGCDE